MRKTRATLLLLAVCVLGVAGCQSPPTGITLPSGSEDLVPCPHAEVPVGSLATMGEPGCDLVGSLLTFPGDSAVFLPGGEVTADGVNLIVIPTPGGTRGTESLRRKVLVTNWGVPGVGVTAYESGRVVQLWGNTDEAVELQRQAVALDEMAER